MSSEDQGKVGVTSGLPDDVELSGSDRAALDSIWGPYIGLDLEKT